MARVATFVPEPVVTLLHHSAQPHNTSVAAARTCYSSRPMLPHEMDADEKARATRDRIAQSIYEAGHHTTIQHPTFTFVLEKVSRHFLWSFLHSHAFYNSEQVSQRYVQVKRANLVAPPFDDDHLPVFEETAHKLQDGYFALIRLLGPAVADEYFRVYPGRRKRPDPWASAIQKKVLEVARYVLPVATTAHLYHTISGLTLHRYHRMCDSIEAPAESRLVVAKMVEAVRAVDPDFFLNLEDPIPLEETPEFKLFEEFRGGRPGPEAAAFVEEFDRSLGPYRSRLVDHKARGQETVAQAVRTMLGLPAASLSDAAAIDRVLNPAQNPYLGQPLNVATHSKLTRALHHPHFTFRKKLSHTADSQDQRHRMTPGSRPILMAQFTPGRPDYVLPDIVTRVPEAEALYRELMTETWAAIGRLVESGAPYEFAQYLLPNATAVRFEESGDLLHHHHKWTTRLCYLAQEEIWRCCVEEVRQVSEIYPIVGQYLRAPCGIRKMAGRTPFCPEGNRFCGVPVWNLDLDRYARII